MSTETSMSSFNVEMTDDQRRRTLVELRTLYVEAVRGKNEDRLRAVEIAMMVLTEPLDFHSDLFPDDADPWEYPCLCRDCLSCA